MTMNQKSKRKARVSAGIKDKFSVAERERLAAEFTERFSKTGRQFMEKPLSAGDVLICAVTSKLFQIMLEEAW